MNKPCCIIMIDSDIIEGEEKIITPKVTMFPRLDIETVNKILNDVLDMDLNDLFILIENGNTRILGDYLVYKNKGGYYWKRIRDKTEVPEELMLNYIPIKPPRG